LTFKIHLSIKNILSEFWKEIPKRPEGKLILCARSNGVITLREKQHERKSLTSGYDILTSLKSTLHFNLEDEILLREEDCNNPKIHTPKIPTAKKFLLFPRNP